MLVRYSPARTVGRIRQPGTRTEHAVKLRHLTISLIATAAVAAPIAGCGNSDASGSAQSPTTASSQSGRSAGAAAVTISDFKFTPGSAYFEAGGANHRDESRHNRAHRHGRQRQQLRHRQHQLGVLGDVHLVQGRDLQLPLQYPPVHARHAHRQVKAGTTSSQGSQICLKTGGSSAAVRDRLRRLLRERDKSPRLANRSASRSTAGWASTTARVGSSRAPSRGSGYGATAERE
jgi:hypothetical protein